MEELGISFGLSHFGRAGAEQVLEAASRPPIASHSGCLDIVDVHLMKVLREAGIVRNVPVGRGRLVSLRREELSQAFPGPLDSVLGVPDVR